MITVGVVAVLLTLAAPSFDRLFSTSHARSTARSFEENLRLGRIEARSRVQQTANNGIGAFMPL